MNLGVFVKSCMWSRLQLKIECSISIKNRVFDINHNRLVLCRYRPAWLPQRKTVPVERLWGNTFFPEYYFCFFRCRRRLSHSSTHRLSFGASSLFCVSARKRKKFFDFKRYFYHCRRAQSDRSLAGLSREDRDRPTLDFFPDDATQVSVARCPSSWPC